MTAPRARRAPAAPISNPSELRAQVAQVTVLIDVEWDRLAHDLPPTAWEEAQRAVATPQRALAAGHRTRAQRALLRLADVLAAGADERRGTDRLLTLIEQKRRLLDTHARMLRKAGRSLTPEDIGVLLEVVRDAATQVGAAPDASALIVDICRARLHRLKTPPARPTRPTDPQRPVLGHRGDRHGESKDCR